MFLLRLKPILLFLLLMIPMIAGAILQQATAFHTEHPLRVMAMGINLSSIFAILFCAWIATITWVVTPGQNLRLLLLVLLGLGMAFRLWQDSWNIQSVYMQGKMLSVEDFPVTSPLFVLHALVSVYMLTLFVLLARWLVRKEIASGKTASSTGITILQFLVFPVGLFWLQKRLRSLIG
jgi:ABC-type uncharacterized transport system permease subunit